MRIVKGSSFATWTKRLQGKSSHSHRRESSKSRIGSPKKSAAEEAALANNKNDNARALPAPPREDREERIHEADARVEQEERRVAQSTDVDVVESKADDEVRDTGPVEESTEIEKQEVKKDTEEEAIVEETKEVVEAIAEIKETVNDSKKKVELETEEDTLNEGENICPASMKSSSWEQIASPTTSDHNEREFDGSNELTDETVVNSPVQDNPRERDAVIASRGSDDEMEGSVEHNHKPVPEQGEDPEQVQGVDPEQVQGVDPEHLQGEDPEQVQGQAPEQVKGDGPEQVKGEDHEVLTVIDQDSRNENDTKGVYEKIQTANSLLEARKKSMASVSEGVSDNSSHSDADSQDSLEEETTEVDFEEEEEEEEEETMEAVFSEEEGEKTAADIEEEEKMMAVDIKDNESQLQNPYLQAQATAARIMALFELGDKIDSHESQENSEHGSKEQNKQNQELSGGNTTDTLGNEETAHVVGEETKVKETKVEVMTSNKKDESLAAAASNKDGAKSPSPASDDKEGVEKEWNERVSSIDGEKKTNIEVTVSSSQDSWDTNGIRHTVSPVRRLLSPKINTWTKMKLPKKKSKSKGNHSNAARSREASAGQDQQKSIDLSVLDDQMKMRTKEQQERKTLNSAKSRSKSSKDSFVGVGELNSSAMRPDSPLQDPSTDPEAILSKLLSEARLSNSSQTESQTNANDAEAQALEHMVMWSDARLGAESFEIVAVKSSSYAKARKEYSESLGMSTAEHTTDDEENGGPKKEKKRGKSKKRKDKVRKGKRKESPKSNKRRDKEREGLKRKSGKRSKRSLAKAHSDLSDIMEHWTCREVVDDGPALCNAIPDEVGEEEDAGCRDITYDLRDMARELAMKGPRVILKWLE